MCDHHFQQTDINRALNICMVVNPARVELNSENVFFSVAVRAREFGLVRQVRPSRPTSPRSFSTARVNHQSSIINLVLSAAASTYTANRPRVSPEIVYRVTPLPRDGVHRRDSAGSGPSVPRVTGGAFFGKSQYFLRGTCLIYYYMPIVAVEKEVSRQKNGPWCRYSTTLRTTWPCAGRLLAVNTIGGVTR